MRDKVFDVLKGYEFRIDTTVLDKRKAQPQLRTSPETFYQYAWYFHMKYVAPQVASWSDELFVIAASISHKRGPKGFRSAVEHVVSQTSPTRTSQVDAWPASTAPCLQVADYCCWAIHRKWERSDARSYELVKDKIRSEYDIFRGGNTLYY